MGDVEVLPASTFAIPVGQMASYVFFSTICFFFRRYKLGLMLSFAYVFNWGFLHGTANFVDAIGRPTMELFLYLGSGLVMAMLVLVGFFREE